MGLHSVTRRPEQYTENHFIQVHLDINELGYIPASQTTLKEPLYVMRYAGTVSVNVLRYE